MMYSGNNKTPDYQDAPQQRIRRMRDSAVHSQWNTIMTKSAVFGR